MEEKGISREPLFQVYATEVKTGALVPVPMFPRAMQQVADEWASTMRLMIAAGKEKRYADPQAVICLNFPTTSL